ncbi:MAG TPA: ABC transporter permease [Vicinamibacterales bacterium]|nr:ABC transporter permease [Vicinamibacterales bacterium]
MWKLLNFLPGRRRRMERDLDKELRYHIDRRVDDLIRNGVSEADARRQVAIEFGGVLQVREAVQEAWAWRWLANARRDWQYAGRLLRRNPVFAATALLSIALGIGASAAVFSLIDQVLLRRLPVSEPDRIVYFNWKGTTLQSNWGYDYLTSYPLCRELQDQHHVFDGVICRHPGTVSFSSGQQAQQVRAEMVSGSYFNVLGVQPRLGRLIDASDDLHPGAHPVVVVGETYWRNQLSSHPEIIGRKVSVSGYPMTVIGVAPASFVGMDPLSPPSLWMPIMMAPRAGNIDAYWDHLMNRRAAWLHVFGRLKPGLSPEAAKTALEPWFQSMLAGEPETKGFPKITAEQHRRFLSSTFDLQPVPSGLSGGRRALQRPLWVLMAGSVLLLLLASLNVAGLLLARGAARAREFTTRMAIGASRGRIAAQLLVESGLIAVAGGALGLLAAPAVSRVILFFLPQSSDVALRVDGRVLAFALITSGITAVLCGLAPALHTGRTPLSASLTDRSRVAAGGGVRLRKVLVAGQLAFTLVLLIGSGLFVQTLTRLHGNLGFDGDHLVTVSLDPPANGYAEPDAERVMREVLQRLQAVPGVERAAVANSGMLTGGAASTMVTIQSDRRFTSDRAAARMRVGPGFFPTIGAQLLAGRDFDERDVRPAGDKPRAYQSVIVSESFVRRYFKDRNPIGARIGLSDRPDTKTTIEIIGVVKDFSRRTLRDQQVETIFLQYWDNQSADGTFYLKIGGNAENAFGAIRSAVARVDPELPVTLTRFNDQIERSLRTERMLASLSSAFGTLALLLAVIGLYGVMAFVVTQRTQEIGLRIALGASRSSAVWLILRDAAVMIGSGMLVAIPATFLLKQFVEAQLFGVNALHPPTIALAGLLLLAVSLAAALVPAWRAATLDPTEALRV